MEVRDWKIFHATLTLNEGLNLQIMLVIYMIMSFKSYFFLNLKYYHYSVLTIITCNFIVIFTTITIIIKIYYAERAI